MTTDYSTTDYFAQKLLENTDELDAIRTKLYMTSCAPLTVEETYALRELLLSNSIYSRNLVNYVRAEKAKKSRIKRIFRK